MKQYFHALAMCQSMFCAIPCPGHIWDEQARGKMLLFLPVIGLEIGAIWACLGWLCEYLEIPGLLRGVILGFWPYMATGGIHLDGFLDVTDAVKSCRDLQRRREILKDSHVGAFAVVGCGMLLLTGLAAGTELPAGKLGLLVLIPVISRCGSALSVTVLRPMSTSQYAVQSIPKGHVWMLSAMLLAALGVSAVWGCIIPCIAVACGYALALGKGYGSLAGMNGDIAGYALTLSELAGLAAGCLV